MIQAPGIQKSEPELPYQSLAAINQQLCDCRCWRSRTRVKSLEPELMGYCSFLASSYCVCHFLWPPFILVLSSLLLTGCGFLSYLRLRHIFVSISLWGFVCTSWQLRLIDHLWLSVVANFILTKFRLIVRRLNYKADVVPISTLTDGSLFAVLNLRMSHLQRIFLSTCYHTSWHTCFNGS